MYTLVVVVGCAIYLDFVVEIRNLQDDEKGVWKKLKEFKLPFFEIKIGGKKSIIRKTKKLMEKTTQSLYAMKILSFLYKKLGIFSN